MIGFHTIKNANVLLLGYCTKLGKMNNIETILAHGTGNLVILQYWYIYHDIVNAVEIELRNLWVEKFLANSVN